MNSMKLHFRLFFFYFWRVTGFSTEKKKTRTQKKDLMFVVHLLLHDYVVCLMEEEGMVEERKISSGTKGWVRARLWRETASKLRARARLSSRSSITAISKSGSWSGSVANVRRRRGFRSWFRRRHELLSPGQEQLEDAVGVLSFDLEV